MDDKHAHTILARWHFLHQRLRRILLFAGGDSNRAFEPLSCRALNVVVDLTAAAAIAADNVAVTTRAQIIEVPASDHAAVTDKHNALKPKAFVEVAKDRRHGVGIAPVSGEHMMRDRPAVDQHQANKHLRIARPTVTAVAVSAQDRGAFALKVGRSQIIKDDIDLERGQIAQAEIELMLDLWLAFEQLVECGTTVATGAAPRAPAVPCWLCAPRHRAMQGPSVVPAGRRQSRFPTTGHAHVRCLARRADWQPAQRLAR